MIRNSVFRMTAAICLLVVILSGSNSDAAEKPAPDSQSPSLSPQTSSPESKNVDPLPWALRPYLVEIQVSFRSSPGDTPAAEQAWLATLENQLRAHFGQMWRLRVQNNPLWISDLQLSEMTDASAALQWKSHPVDKLFRLSLLTSPDGRTSLCGREWDLASQSLGSFLQRRTDDPRETSAVACSLICDLFRPLMEIRVVEGKQLEGILRAGEFPPPVPEDQPIAADSFLVPFLRFHSRKQEFLRIQHVPWTFLQVTSLDRARATLKMTSTFRTPIPQPSPRVETMAMLVRPHWSSTEVKISPRGTGQAAFMGARVQLRPLEEANHSSDEESVLPVVPPVEFITDRNGCVRLPARNPLQLQSFEVLSGEFVLARVPILAGSVPSLELETPDDRPRLALEGAAHLLEGELTEIVATREVLIARIKAAADKKDWTEVDKFLADLDRLQSRKQFLDRIERLQLPAVQAAKAARDRVAQTRIERRCNALRDSAQKHLDPARTSEFRKNLETLRHPQESQNSL